MAALDHAAASATSTSVERTAAAAVAVRLDHANAVSADAASANAEAAIVDAPIATAPRPPLVVEDLGATAYHPAREHQLARVEARKTGAGADRLLFVEHPHVFTLGRAQKAVANVLAPGDVEVIEIERGGDVTYHGPGQLVAYPILLLGDGERDLHRFLRNLEEAVIQTVAQFGLVAGRNPGATGVWLDGRDGSRKKLCSMGIACRRWVTFHGLALNVATDLSYFARINPCGFASSVMTSMAVELDRPITVAEVQPVLARALADVLGRTLA